MNELLKFSERLKEPVPEQYEFTLGEEVRAKGYDHKLNKPAVFTGRVWQIEPGVENDTVLFNYIGSSDGIAEDGSFKGTTRYTYVIITVDGHITGNAFGLFAIPMKFINTEDAVINRFLNRQEQDLRFARGY